MKSLRKCLVLVLCLTMVCALGACGRKTASGYYEDFDDETENSSVEEIVSNDESSSDGASSTESKKNTVSNGASSVKSGSTGKRTNTDIWQIRRNVKPSAEKSVIKNLNLGGKELKMLVWNSNYTEQDEKIVKAFEKKYNCKIKVTNANYESYFNIISTQLSAGKPFDIIKMHRAHFPHAAIVKMIQPLENYISNEDITNTSKNPGIDWDWTYINASWNDHIYYTISGRPCALPIIVYNKLLFKNYGLEDPLELWNKGGWTAGKIEEYAKQVGAQGMYLYDSTVSKKLAARGGDPDYYSIDKSGKVTWLGANTAMKAKEEEAQRLLKLSSVSEMGPRLDSMISGKCMMHCIELDQLVVQAKALAGSAAFGKDINNVGIAPLPLKNDGTYYSTGVSGYAASRGCDPTAAIAMTVFYSMQNEGWDTNAIPAVQANRELLYSLYDKMTVVENYTFLTADGKEESDILYPMSTEIEKGGDIAKLQSSYAPKIKSLLEYSLSKQ